MIDVIKKINYKYIMIMKKVIMFINKFPKRLYFILGISIISILLVILSSNISIIKLRILLK